MSRKTEPTTPEVPKQGDDRSSPCFISDERVKAEREASNSLRQFDRVTELIDHAESAGRFALRPSTIQELHRIAIDGIYGCAGSYRTAPIVIRGSQHTPPSWEHVSRLVEEMCEYVGDEWDQNALHLSSYVMWRVNWIHPFMGGNGRTARAVSYLVLCAKLGHSLPGTTSIPEQIAGYKTPYYDALDAADAAWASGAVDVSKMEELLERLLAEQLASVIANARGMTGGKA